MYAELKRLEGPRLSRAAVALQAPGHVNEDSNDDFQQASTESSQMSSCHKGLMSLFKKPGVEADVKWMGSAGVLLDEETFEINDFMGKLIAMKFRTLWHIARVGAVLASTEDEDWNCSLDFYASKPAEQVNATLGPDKAVFFFNPAAVSRVMPARSWLLLKEGPLSSASTDFHMIGNPDGVTRGRPQVQRKKPAWGPTS
jgi:hypothetical protein